MKWTLFLLLFIASMLHAQEQALNDLIHKSAYGKPVLLFLKNNVVTTDRARF